MTNFPASIDDDVSLPPVSDNIVEVGAEAIQAIRSALFAVETEIGIGASGSTGSIANRLDVSLNDDGTVKPSALIGIGLVALPITNSQISPTAGISESKLNLTFTTQLLHDLFTDLDNRTAVLEGFVSIEGIKIAPHIAGTDYRHKLSHIDVDSGTLNRVNIDAGTLVARTLTNAYTFTSQHSEDFLKHVRADGIDNTTTPPANQAHNALGIYIDPSNFISVPQTNNDLQRFAEYVDSSSLALLGSRTQNLYSNGIPRNSRANSLVNNEAGEAILDPTPATAFLLYTAAVNPVDDIAHGDNIILLTPDAGPLASNVFDAQFSQVKSGDYITVDYGNDTPIVTFVVDSVKKSLNGSSRAYIVRINGKNLYNTTSAVVRIDRPFYHESSFNSLAVCGANNSFASIPSLIIASPRGATALGITFNPDQINFTHFNLYLAIYPTGNPSVKTHFLPPIDVSGNLGTTPGRYTLDGVVAAINDKVRANGYNYRFVAFAYNGQFGITLADHYNDVSFSIIGGVVDTNGSYTASSNVSYPNNVIDNFNNYDALGLGTSGSNVASPPYAATYTSPLSALTTPTLILAPTRRNFFYVDGVEKDNFILEPQITRDGYGDGYWNAIITTRTPLSDRVEVSYDIELDLSWSGLQIGKTIVVQPAVAFDSGSYNPVDYGRFTISNVVFTNCPGPMPITTITVYDGISGTGVSPQTSSVSFPVKIYFTGDSVSFDAEQVGDVSINQSFKRFFEVFVSTTGDSFTHERARFNVAGSDLLVDSITGFTLYSDVELAALNIVDVSPKLRGYSFAQYKKINLFIESFDNVSGIFTGYLCKFVSPSTFTNKGPTITGKKGEVIRFYDETCVDYIDIKFELTDNISAFVLKRIDIQIFPSLELNQEKIIVGKCQVNDTTKKVSFINDARQFGNVSEKQFSTSALDYISASDRLLSENGVVRGFDLISSTSGGKISIKGGTALIDGKIVEFNDEVLYAPVIQETLFPTFTTDFNNVKWYLCANNKGDFEFVASTDYNTFDPGTGSYAGALHTRLFYVKNPNSLSTTPYAIRSGYLQDIMLNKRDLVPLFVVKTTTGLSGTYILTATSVSDIRRYIAQGYQGLEKPFVLSSTGSLRTLTAAQNIINELITNISYTTDRKNVFGQTVYVRDAIDISGFTFNNLSSTINTVYIGEGGSFNVSTALTLVSQNVEFRNLILNVATGTGFQVLGNDVVFDNNTINYTYDATVDGFFSTTQLGNASAKACILCSDNTGDYTYRRNITITNNNFVSEIRYRFPFVLVYSEEFENTVENVKIDNNRVNTLTALTIEDKRAVFAIVVNSSETQTINPRLINCSISHNIFNKNQMIMISSVPNGGGNIQEMFIPINVKIAGNVCGSINYLTKYGQNLSTPNTLFNYDKNNALHITDNVCRYIYCGTSTGFINVIGSVDRVIYDIETAEAIYSSSVNILNNVCSWIHIGVKDPTSFAVETPAIVVQNNRLSAFDPAFLTDYHSVITPENIGLIIDRTEGT